MAVDPADGEVFVADTSNNRIQVFSPSGQPLRRFGSVGSGPGQMSQPAGVGVSPVAPNDVYVVDTNNSRIERFTGSGTFVAAFGTFGTGAGQLQLPRSVAFDPSGNVYVGDNGANQRISVFAADGTFQRTIATGFRYFNGLTASPGAGGDLFGTDRDSGAAQRFSFDGTTGGPLQSGVLNAPAGIGADERGDVFVADSGNHRVAIFGAAGPLLSSFGQCCGAGEGTFLNPTGVAWSPLGGDVYVAEGNNCCTRISAWKRVPDPQLGRSMDIQVDKGTVLFKPPGSKRFQKLTKTSLVPNGTVIDARRGTVGITSVTATRGLQSADFYSGVFKAIQKPVGGGLTEARLVGGSFKGCPGRVGRTSRASAAKKKQRIRKLWGSGAGQFRTQGRFAAAVIRGTTWLTDDRCDGTLIRVTEGSVAVRDLVRKKTVVVKAGGQYFARAPRRR